MSINKVNTRSPFYVVSTGTEESTIENASIEISGPAKGTYGTDITLSINATNFTPQSYAWTGGAIAGNATAAPTFTQSGSGSSVITYGCTVTDSNGTEYTATKDVTWNSVTQYEITLQVTNSIAGPSAGYTFTGLTFNSTTGYWEAKKVGAVGASYSFAFSVAVNSGYTEDSTLTFSPVSPIAGTIGSSDATVTSTVTGTVSLTTAYYLTRSTSNVYEGNTFDITLTTDGIANDTSVPFTITGVQAADLVRGTLTGAFIIEDGQATQTFAAVADNTSEGDETFTLTLDNISPTNSISVIISDTNTNTPVSILVSADGYSNNNLACEQTAAETAYYGLATSQSLGNGVILYKTSQLDNIPNNTYTNSGDYYKIGTSHYCTIGADNDGKIDQYNECPTLTTKQKLSQTSGTNSIIISSSSTSTLGPDGANVCDLEADTTVYYSGFLQDGASLFTNSDLTAPLGGSDNYYRLLIPNCTNTLVSYYARVLSYPPGYVTNINQCGFDPNEYEVPTCAENLTPEIVISDSTIDGTGTQVAFTSQKSTLSVSVSNLSGTLSYQWYKGTSSSGGTASLSSISGETSDKLIINDGGETQTSVANMYYNVKVNGSYEADNNYLIAWTDRPSYACTYVSGTSASSGACSGAAQTIYGNRAAVTAFCVPGAIFYSNLAGSSFAAVGSYAFNDGSNHNYRYVTTNGVAQLCVDGGCAGTPSQPTSGTITKFTGKRCDAPSTFQNFIINDAQYDNEGYILDINDLGQNGGAGCYEIVELFSKTDTITNYISFDKADGLVRLQPYTSCSECQGEAPAPTPTPTPEITYYYARFVKAGGTTDITAVRSTAQIPTNIVIKVGNSCREYLDDIQVTGAADISTYTQYYTVAGCNASITPTPTPSLAYFRRYGDCATNGSDILKDYGSTTDLGSNWPATIYDGVCMKDMATSGSSSTQNVSNLIQYFNCTECTSGQTPTPTPTPTPTTPYNKAKITSDTRATSVLACSDLTSYNTKVFYSGTLGDGVTLYTDSTLTTKYNPSSNTFVRSSSNSTFRIGVTNTGEISNFSVC